jgi:thiol-disulfide isomerase/thioredoxin
MLGMTFRARTGRRPRAMLLVLVMVLAACTAKPDEDPDRPPSSSPALPATPEALPATSVPQFQDLLVHLEGTPVVVNAWASWCGPCEAETPKLVDAADRHPDVQFLGVDTQDSRDGAEGFIAEHRVPYPSVFDPTGAILTSLDASGPPITVFYRADGTVEGTVPGELSQEALDQHLAAIAPA